MLGGRKTAQEKFWAPASECPKECFLSAFWRFLGLKMTKSTQKALFGALRGRCPKLPKKALRGALSGPGPKSTPVNGGQDRKSKTSITLGGRKTAQEKKKKIRTNVPLILPIFSVFSVGEKKEKKFPGTLFLGTVFFLILGGFSPSEVTCPLIRNHCEIQNFKASFLVPKPSSHRVSTLHAAENFK